MSRENAIIHANSYFDDGGLQHDLGAWVAFETESQNPEKSAELSRYLSQAIEPRLKALGFECTIHDNPDPAGGPLLVGTRIEDPALTTVLTYGHGDVTWGQGAEWSDGLSPFVLTADGDRLYGRGAADNKVQHLINMLYYIRVRESEKCIQVIVRLSEPLAISPLPWLIMKTLFL